MAFSRKRTSWLTIRSLLAWPRRPASDIRDDGRAAVEQVLGLFGAARQETDWNELKPCFGERCKLRDAVGSEEQAVLGPDVRGLRLVLSGRRPIGTT